MILERIKSILLSIALGAHNAAVVVILNIIAWRNNLWNEKRWTKKGTKKPETESPAVASKLNLALSDQSSSNISL
jgi:hypothetical protein